MALLILYVAFFSSCEKFESYAYSTDEKMPITGWIDSVKAAEIREGLINTMNNNELLGLQVCVALPEEGSWSLSLGTKSPAQADSF